MKFVASVGKVFLVYIFFFSRLPNDFNIEINENTKSLIEKSSKLLVKGRKIPAFSKLRNLNEKLVKHLPAKDPVAGNLTAEAEIGEKKAENETGEKKAEKNGESSIASEKKEEPPIGSTRKEDKQEVPLGEDCQNSMEIKEDVHESLNGEANDGLQHGVVNKKARYTSPLEYRYKKR